MAQVRTWLFEFQALGCCFRRAFWSEITFSSMGAAGLRSVLYVFQNEFSIQNRTHKMRILISKCNFYMKQFLHEAVSAFIDFGGVNTVGRTPKGTRNYIFLFIFKKPKVHKLIKVHERRNLRFCQANYLTTNLPLTIRDVLASPIVRSRVSSGIGQRHRVRRYRITQAGRGQNGNLCVCPQRPAHQVIPAFLCL